MATKKIPFYQICVGEEEIEAAARVIRSGWLTQGPEVEAFEAEAAAMLGAPPGHECVAVSSCTAGLYLLMQALAWTGPGKKIVVPTMTFAATINAVIAAGAEPVIHDVDMECRLRIGESMPDSDGVVYVHFAGLDQFVAGRARDIGRGVIHDQAHSFQPGAYLQNSVWSFFPTKNITAGEGGLIGCRSIVAEQIRKMRDHGRSGTYEVEYPGSLNFRMTDIQAAILREQLKKLPWILARKRRVANIYREQFVWHDLIKPPPHDVTHLFWVRVKNPGSVMEALHDRGIETSVHYRPLHQMDAYKQYAPSPCPNADRIYQNIVSLPFWPMSDGEAMDVATAFVAEVERLSRSGK